MAAKPIKRLSESNARRLCDSAQNLRYGLRRNLTDDQNRWAFKLKSGCVSAHHTELRTTFALLW